MESEIKAIPGFLGYHAGTDGSIWSMRRSAPRKLKTGPVEGGYPAVRVRHDSGRFETIKVQRLVLLAWRGLPPAGKNYSCHENGIRTDCALSNLRWDTAKANAEDSRRLGTMSVGSSHPISKLTDDQVRSIRAKYAEGDTLRALETLFRVRFTTIWHIVKRKTWKHL